VAQVDFPDNFEVRSDCVARSPVSISGNTAYVLPFGDLYFPTAPSNLAYASHCGDSAIIFHGLFVSCPTFVLPFGLLRVIKLSGHGVVCMTGALGSPTCWRGGCRSEVFSIQRFILFYFLFICEI